MNANLDNSWNSEADPQDGRVHVRRLETRPNPLTGPGPGALHTGVELGVAERSPPGLPGLQTVLDSTTPSSCSPERP
mgnify:CR=1 FL=1